MMAMVVRGNLRLSIICWRRNLLWQLFETSVENTSFLFPISIRCPQSTSDKADWGGDVITIETWCGVCVCDCICMWLRTEWAESVCAGNSSKVLKSTVVMLSYLSSKWRWNWTFASLQWKNTVHYVLTWLDICRYYSIYFKDSQT